ncbi:hypothetical protein GG344DRAFT_66655 [Lentinula edodes]|nr:hypothetical protein GG344DRAFT_66655 [Lentinula edodes]
MTDQSKYETVFLGGLPHCSREEIINLCGSTGRIASTRVRRGYAFIDYFNPADADFGIQHLHGIEFKGKRIIAEFARRLPTPTRSHSTTTMAAALSVDPWWFVIDAERKDTGRVNALKFSEPRLLGAFVVDLQTTTSDTVHVDPSLLIAARDPEITRLALEAATTTTDITVPKLAFTDPGLANSATATTTPWINPKLILRVPILASDLTMRGDDTILEPGLPLLMMIPIQYHYIRHFHRILNMFQVGSMVNAVSHPLIAVLLNTCTKMLIVNRRTLEVIPAPESVLPPGIVTTLARPALDYKLLGGEPFLEITSPTTPEISSKLACLRVQITISLLAALTRCSTNHPLSLRAMKELYGMKIAPRGLVYAPPDLVKDIPLNEQLVLWALEDDNSERNVAA